MPIEVSCIICGKKKKVKPYVYNNRHNFFCSMVCKNKYQIGKPTWNKGKTGIQKSHRKGINIVKEYGEEKANIIIQKMSLCRILNPPTKETRRKAAITMIKNGKTKGNLNHNWKGGITESRELIRKSPIYKEWRLQVFGRDNFTCQRCKIRGDYLEAHHIKSFTKFIELRFVVSNGITLCNKCHKYYHSNKIKIGE